MDMGAPFAALLRKGSHKCGDLMDGLSLDLPEADEGHLALPNRVVYRGGPLLRDEAMGRLDGRKAALDLEPQVEASLIVEELPHFGTAVPRLERTEAQKVTRISPMRWGCHKGCLADSGGPGLGTARQGLPSRAGAR